MKVEAEPSGVPTFRPASAYSTLMARQLMHSSTSPKPLAGNLAIACWSLLCLALAWTWSHRWEGVWRQEQSGHLRRLAIAAGQIITFQQMVPSAEGRRSWGSLEQLLQISLMPLPSVSSDDPSVRDASPSMPSISDPVWTREADRRWRVSVEMDLPEAAPQARRLLAVRFADPQVAATSSWFGLRPWQVATMLWALGAAGWWFAIQWPRRQQMQREAEMARWSQSVLEDVGGEIQAPRGIIDPDSPVANPLETAFLTINRRLIESQQSSRTTGEVLDEMREGVLTVDHQMHLSYLNRAAGEMLPISGKSPIGRPLVEAIRIPGLVDLVQRTMQQETTEREATNDSNRSFEGAGQEGLLELGSTQPRFLRARATRYRQPTGLPQVLVTLADETQLRKLENLRRDFTANVSHELKTPLSSIKAYAETLLIGALEDPEHNRGFVERIAEQSDRLEQLIFDLLKLAQLQDSALLKPEPLLLRPLLEQSRNAFLPIAQRKGVTLEFDLQISPSLEMQTDRDALLTIVNNLISNAVRYTPSGGKVLVQAESMEEQIVLAVRDTGIGIAPEDLPRIFERFFRVEKARTQEAGGTGLGLAIVKHLVTSMQGQIDVESQVGSGSTFRLQLPRILTEPVIAPIS
jgi:two-component system phosphate regulon sensor histidine kinase PhoR